MGHRSRRLAATATPGTVSLTIMRGPGLTAAARMAVGASHQTGRTGVVANLIEMFGNFNAEENLEGGKQGYLPGWRRGERIKTYESDYC